MRITDFRSQKLSQRFDTLVSWGFMMLRTGDSKQSRILFSIHGFFAELVLDKNSNRVLEINSFSIEELSMEYYMLIDHDNPFMEAALANADILGELSVAA